LRGPRESGKGKSKMTLKDFEELVELQGELRKRIATLTELFHQGVPLSPEIEFTPEQKKAIKDVDQAWDKFRQKARVFGALVD
jgi:hypothetical protein